MACRFSGILYAIIQFITFALVVIATAIDMFKIKDRGLFDSEICITLWGIQNACYTLSYEAKSDRLWADCPSRRDLFRLAEAFAVISIFVSGTAFIFGFVTLFCCFFLRWACVALNILGIVTIVIVWASMATTYRQQFLLCVTLNEFFNFGVGFALFVLAWCLDILNIIFAVLPF